MNQQYHEELLRNQQSENIVDNTNIETEISFTLRNLRLILQMIKVSPSNDLKEFGVDTDEPDLFNSENQNENVEDLLNSSEDEDDLRNTSIFKKTKKLMVFKKINGSHHGIGCSKTLSGTAK